MVMFALALKLVEIIVQVTANSDIRPRLGHWTASVTLEAQTAALDRDMQGGYRQGKRSSRQIANLRSIVAMR